MKESKPPQIDQRYAAIRAVLPDEPVLQYLSDVPEQGNSVEAFSFQAQAQYALAPHLLIAGSAQHFAIANLKEPKNLLRLCRDHRMLPLAVDADGVALLRSIGN